MKFECPLNRDKISELTFPFDKMFTKEALSHAEKFLYHEKNILTKLLDRLNTADTVVIIGSGPDLYKNIVIKNQKKYIGIDPIIIDCFQHHQKSVRYIQDYFENIERSQIGDGNCLFVFWFNVMHYIRTPEIVLNRILKGGDIVFHSTWKRSNIEYKTIKNYFQYIYEDDSLLYKTKVNNILKYPYKISPKLNANKKIQYYENDVNIIEIIHLT